MSLIKTIDRIPVYSRLEEALKWGRERNIKGYHIHLVNGQVGYMSGESHANITLQNISTPVAPTTNITRSLPRVQQIQPIQIVQQPVQRAQQQPIIRRQSSSTSSSSSGSSGGGGGY